MSISSVVQNRALPIFFYIVILVNYGILMISSVSSHKLLIHYPSPPDLLIIVKYLFPFSYHCFKTMHYFRAPAIFSDCKLHGKNYPFGSCNFHIALVSHLFMPLLANIFIYIPSISEADLKWHMIK